MKRYYLILFLAVISFSCSTDDSENLDENLITANSLIAFRPNLDVCQLCVPAEPNPCGTFTCGFIDGVKDGSRDREDFVGAIGGPQSVIETTLIAFNTETLMFRPIDERDDLEEDEIAVIGTRFVGPTSAELSILWHNNPNTQFRLNFFNEQRAANAAPGSEYWRGINSGYVAGGFFGGQL